MMVFLIDESDFDRANSGYGKIVHPRVSLQSTYVVHILGNTRAAHALTFHRHSNLSRILLYETRSGCHLASQSPSDIFPHIYHHVGPKVRVWGVFVV